MNRSRGMTLTELLIALAIASIVGVGVVAMTEAVVRVLEDGRTERERTIASAVAASRLSSVVAPSNCTLELAQDMTVFWKSDTRRDGHVQATELAWVMFNESTGELVLEWVEFPESYTPNERNRADQTCSLDEDYALLRQEYADVGHLARRVLLDELDHVEYAIPESDCASPLSQQRVAWRISWKGATGVDATTVVTSGLHAHVIPEEDG